MSENQLSVLGEELQKLRPDVNAKALDGLPPESRNQVIDLVGEMNAKFDQVTLDKIANEPQLLKEFNDFYSLIESQTNIKEQLSATWDAGSLGEKARILPDLIRATVTANIAREVFNRSLKGARDKAITEIHNRTKTPIQEIAEFWKDTEQYFQELSADEIIEANLSGFRRENK